MLPPLIAGDLRVTLAYPEPASRYDPHHIETHAEAVAGGWRLTGEKVHVLDGYGADRFVVSARTAGGVASARGITLFLVDGQAAGASVERQWRIDSRNVARLRLRDAGVTAADVIGAVDAGGELLTAVLDRATIGLCAEMLGGMSAALQMTLDYLKTRVQFGVPIGSFQALKHRAAKMYIETELARSAVLAAHQALDQPAPNLGHFACLAKARCSDAFVLIGNETIQMHGGIGMTDEHDAGFFLKRARVAEVTFGDAAYQRQRFATLHGY